MHACTHRKNARKLRLYSTQKVKENGEKDLKYVSIGFVKRPGVIEHLAALKEGANDSVLV